MARDFFHLVPRIVQEPKYVDVSVRAIIRAICSEAFKPQFTREFVTEDSDGSQVSVYLTVNIGGSPDSIIGWSAALMMHSVRIDGVDYEYGYEAMDGNEYDGWHRHVWDARLREADSKKIPLEGYDDCRSLDSFLFRISRTMKITWNGADDADLFEVER
jgi:hypothetical protein